MKKKATIFAIVTLLIIGVTSGALLKSFNKEKNSSQSEIESHKEGIEKHFCADSAYSYIAEQCAFGPRIMNSKAHDDCEEWITNKFKNFGCEVTLQRVKLKGYDGTTLNSCNIIAQYRPELKQRILLCAHWDTRPWADNDPDSTNWKTPVLGANDGASGIAVMLEIARIINELKNDSAKLELGIDFVCFDAEDWGTPQWAKQEDDPDSWALGAQYYANNLPKTTLPSCGILLDMVGGQNAKFYKEGISLNYAQKVVDRVWELASLLGHGNYFPQQMGGYVTDDHVPLNEIAKIPTIDLIPFYPDCPQSSFGWTWHTVNDNLEHIDKNILNIVGRTVLGTLSSLAKRPL